MLVLYEPKLKDYWYEQELLSNQDTMSYNSGWNVSYDGYHYDTGCIDFPESKWQDKYNKRHNNDNYFYYLKDKDNFVGTACYYLEDNKWNCSIVIEHKYRGNGYGKEGLKLLCEKAFNDNRVYEIYDTFEKERMSTSIFTELGFKTYNEIKSERFNKEIKIIEVKLTKEEFNR